MVLRSPAGCINAQLRFYYSARRKHSFVEETSTGNPKNNETSKTNHTPPTKDIDNAAGQMKERVELGKEMEQKRVNSKQLLPLFSKQRPNLKFKLPSYAKNAAKSVTITEKRRLDRTKYRKHC